MTRIEIEVTSTLPLPSTDDKLAAAVIECRAQGLSGTWSASASTSPHLAQEFLDALASWPQLASQAAGSDLEPGETRTLGSVYPAEGQFTLQLVHDQDGLALVAAPIRATPGGLTPVTRLIVNAAQVEDFISALTDPQHAEAGTQHRHAVLESEEKHEGYEHVLTSVPLIGLNTRGAWAHVGGEPVQVPTTITDTDLTALAQLFSEWAELSPEDEHWMSGSSVASLGELAVNISGHDSQANRLGVAAALVSVSRIIPSQAAQMSHQPLWHLWARPEELSMSATSLSGGDSPSLTIFGAIQTRL